MGRGIREDLDGTGVRRALVTGGAGFIGSAVVDTLIAEDAAVLVLDDMSRGSKSNLTSASTGDLELCEIDVRDGDAVARAFRTFRPEVVFHLAAQIDVRKSMSSPAHDASINVIGSLNVFSAAVETGVRRVVNTSTGGAIYGGSSMVPTPESAPAEPLSAYGLSKRTVECYAEWFGRTYGLDVLTLRYGNVYGPRQDPRGEAGVIANFCERILQRQRPVIFGDGSQTRDFVYVGDVAAANLAAARTPAPSHRVYNIGTGIEVTIAELAATVAKAAGVDPGEVAPEFAPARPGEVHRSCLDVHRAFRDLALAPPIPLLAGLSETLAWIRTL